MTLASNQVQILGVFFSANLGCLACYCMKRWFVCYACRKSFHIRLKSTKIRFCKGGIKGWHGLAMFWGPQEVFGSIEQWCSKWRGGRFISGSPNRPQNVCFSRKETHAVNSYHPVMLRESFFPFWAFFWILFPCFFAFLLLLFCCSPCFCFYVFLLLRFSTVLRVCFCFSLLCCFFASPLFCFFASLLLHCSASLLLCFSTVLLVCFFLALLLLKPK